MAHLSLYRKYRPQSFAEVVGQQHVTRTLQAAIEQDRLAHALLFSGPRGTGKTSTARILAKALNCETPGSSEPCGECTSCLQITSGSSLDVVEIDAASHGSVDDARDLREKVAYSSVAGRWKVYILDECHMLSPAANNALLKVLEEPPEHVAFVFATTEPHKVLQTVQDRCQRYEFRSVSSLDTAGRLAQICEEEGITADPEAITLISSRAGGSMRDALSLLDQLRAFAGETIAVGDLAQLLGKLPDEVLFEAVDLISERDIGAVFAFAERLIRSGVDIREFARALTDHLRSLFLVLHTPAAREILEVTDDGLTRLQEQANHLGSTETLRLIDLTNEIGLQLRQAVEPRLSLEVGLARMTRPDLHASPASLLARLDRLERRLGADGTPEASARPPRRVSALAGPPGTPAGSGAPAPAQPEAARKPPAVRDLSPAGDPADTAAGVPATRSSSGRAAAATRGDGSPPPAADATQTLPGGPATGPRDIVTRPEGTQASGGRTTVAPGSGSGGAHRDATAASAGRSVPPAPAAAAPPPDRSQASAPAAAPPDRPQPAAPAPASTPPDRSIAPDQPDVVPAEEPGELDLDRVIRSWSLIRDKVKRRKISFHAVLLPAQPVAYRDGELVLEFGPRSGFHRDRVADSAQNGPLLEAFAEVLGVTPRLRCVLGREPGPGSGPAAETPPDEDGPSDGDGTEPPEDVVEMVRRAFKGTEIVENP